MTKISDVYDYLCELAPLELQLPFDNSGFLLGRKDGEVKRVLLALDVTPAVISEAIGFGAELIISHHPVIFSPLKSVTDEKYIRLAENRMAVISMHTNLDIAEGGVNDVLLSSLGAEYTGALDKDGCGRIGTLQKEMPLQSFIEVCKGKLGCKGIRYYDSGKSVKNIAVMGGSGGDALGDAAQKGCDTYVTADIKYHQFLCAAELGINLIDADHFCTENPVMPVLQKKLAEHFSDTDFILSKSHKAIIEFA